MDHSSIDRRTFVQQLLHGRERVLLTSAAAQRTLPFSDGAEAMNNAHGDAGDESVSFMLNDLRVLETNRQVAELAAIHRALIRIESGTYGTCERCGVEIAHERLKAQPTATSCVDCQRVRERTHWPSSAQPV